MDTHAGRVARRRGVECGSQLNMYAAIYATYLRYAEIFSDHPPRMWRSILA